MNPKIWVHWSLQNINWIQWDSEHDFGKYFWYKPLQPSLQLHACSCMLKKEYSWNHLQGLMPFGNEGLLCRTPLSMHIARIKWWTNAPYIPILEATIVPNVRYVPTDTVYQLIIGWHKSDKLNICLLIWYVYNMSCSPRSLWTGWWCIIHLLETVSNWYWQGSADWVISWLSTSKL